MSDDKQLQQRPDVQLSQAEDDLLYMSDVYAGGIVQYHRAQAQASSKLAGRVSVSADAHYLVRKFSESKAEPKGFSMAQPATIVADELSLLGLSCELKPEHV